MRIPASKLVRQIICLRVMNDNVWNADRNAEREQKVDDKRRPLFVDEVVVVPHEGAGDPVTCRLRTTHGAQAPRGGDTMIAEQLAIELYVDRDGRPRWSLVADSASRVV